MVNNGVSLDISDTIAKMEGFERELFEVAIPRAMAQIGFMMQSYARDDVPVKTGHLQASITHRETITSRNYTTEVGTNVEYAPYIEYGTGPRGDPSVPHTPEMTWVYYDADGEVHIGVSQPARPFLRPAVYDHVGEYKDILEKSIQEAFER